MSDGYHYEWHKDNAWKIGSGGFTKCRVSKCPNSPVATFTRHSFARNKNYPYAYCAEHLYGRRIVDGVVVCKRLIPNEQ